MISRAMRLRCDEVTVMQSGAAPVDPDAYSDDIKALFGASIIGYWDQSDRSGVTALDISGNARNGTYLNSAGVLTGIALAQPGIGDYKTSAYYDGTGYCNIYSAGLAGAFNGAEGAMMAWVKIPQAAWDDNLTHYVMGLRADGNNRISISKSATDRFTMVYDAGATVSQASLISVVDTDLVHVGISWSKSNDRVRFWIYGARAGAEVNGLGTWVGNLASTYCNIGCYAQTPTFTFIGNIAHAVVLNREPTEAEMLRAGSLYAGGTATAWTIPQGGAAPAVALTFDDEYESVYTYGYGYMHPLDLNGSFMVTTNFIDGANDPPYITTAELQEMDAGKWAICNHSMSHPDMSALTPAQVQAEWEGAAAVLQSAGIGANKLIGAYPSGAYDADAIAGSQAAGMLMVRRTIPTTPILVTSDAAANYAQPCAYRFGNADTLYNAIWWANQTLKQNKVMIIYAHKLVTGAAADATQWETWKFQAFVNWCVYHNIPFITLRQFYDCQAGPVTVTRTLPA